MNICDRAAYINNVKIFHQPLVSLEDINLKQSARAVYDIRKIKLFICRAENREPKHGRIISHLSTYHGISYHTKEMKDNTINTKFKCNQREHIHYDTLIITKISQ